MNDSSEAAPAAAPVTTHPGALAPWLRRGARTAWFGQPDWRGLQVTPAVVAGLVIAGVLLDVLVQRLYVVGPARFWWPALMSGWLPTLVTAWVCWLLVPHAGAEPDADPARAPSAMALFAMHAAQIVAIWAVLALVQVPLQRAGWLAPEVLGRWGAWIAWMTPWAWGLAALLLLLWRGGRRSPALRGQAIALVCAVYAVASFDEPQRLWYPDEPANAAANPAPMQLTQETLEAQAAILATQLAAVAAQRPGLVDVYAITFAPYADEDVFLRESRMVAGVMAERFDASGLQLVNHRSTLRESAWATPLNLRRTIEHIAARMDRDEDILFIHLTSHGARSGSLAASFWPLAVEPLTPEMLKAALDAAGIRHRIISVSACYSGSWIAPLADAHTLVMSAADAEHTSYGCGRKSELTFFGRALFDEQLRRKTLSFETAHAEARRVIAQREKEAGKDDGYSNPQIRVGEAMRQRLARLERQRSAAVR